MTGEHAAPYAVAAVVAAIIVPVLSLDDTRQLWAKIAIGACVPAGLLATSIVAAARSAWKTERSEREKLAGRLTPRIIIRSEDNEGIYGDIGAHLEPFKYVQLVIESATDAPLVNSEVWVTGVYKADDQLRLETALVEQPARCEWHGRNLKDNEVATIPAGLSQRVRLFMMGETHPYPTPLFGMPNAIFSAEIESPGALVITVLVAAEDAKSESKSFIFSWSGFDDVKLVERRPCASASIPDAPALPPGQPLRSRR